MTRNEVIKKMGQPESIHGKEYLIYSSKKTGGNKSHTASEEYYILLIDGKAISYGPKLELKLLKTKKLITYINISNSKCLCYPQLLFY